MADTQTKPLNPLFVSARTAMANSHSPYSQFPVGAALRTASGQIFCGCNVENTAYPEGWCAETSAIAAMVTAGENRISEILVLAEKMEAITPCGGCRQRIAEFSDETTKVHLCDQNGIVKTLTLDQLLPSAFQQE